MKPLLNKLGAWLVRYLAQPRRQGAQVATCSPDQLAAALRPGDVLLVEGSTRISVAIKYLTQSTWSHAALYVGDQLGAQRSSYGAGTLIEVDMVEGVRVVPLAAYAGMHTRICRPI